jgi:peptidoglycan DL-endopeptidase CwlO
VQTPERDRRTSSNARRLAATATLAAATIVGAAVGSTPANASEKAAAPATATAITPIGTLVANHSSVTIGSTVTFTVTDRTSAGKAVPSALAAFYVHTVSGWKKVTTAHLSSAGKTTFSFKPNYEHAYKVDLAAVTTGGVSYAAVNTPAVTVAAKAADTGSAIVAAAAKEKGRPYKYGADGPNAFDCSGLTKYVLAKFGVDLPHNANAQKSYGTRVSASSRKPGDLVFVLDGSHATHVAIYAGNGEWWEAPHTGADVRLVKIWSTDIEYRQVH